MNRKSGILAFALAMSFAGCTVQDMCGKQYPNQANEQYACAVGAQQITQETKDQDAGLKRCADRFDVRADDSEQDAMQRKQMEKACEVGVQGYYFFKNSQHGN